MSCDGCRAVMSSLVMLVAQESPLRRIPAAALPLQQMFFDGIRYSIDMADEAFMQTKQSLLAYTRDAPGERDAGNLTRALLGAWAFVDCLHRLHNLLRQMRGLRNSPGLTVFRRKLEAVETSGTGYSILRAPSKRSARKNRPGGTWLGLSLSIRLKRPSTWPCPER